MNWYYGYGPGVGGMLLMVFSAVLVIGGALAITHLALRRKDGGAATRILEKRLARGEIDPEEFQRVRRTSRAS